MTVFSYIDDYPTLLQDDIVKYFCTRHEGVLKFDQSTLSCKIRAKKKTRRPSTWSPQCTVIKMFLCCDTSHCREGTDFVGQEHGGEGWDSDWVLSHIPFFISDLIQIPLTFLISYSSHIPIPYLLSHHHISISPLFSFSSPLLYYSFHPFMFTPCDWQTCSSISSCSHIMCWMLTQISCYLIAPHCSPISSSASAPCFPNLLYSNSVSPLIQTNLIIVFLCVTCILLDCSYPTNSLSFRTPLWPLLLLPLSDFCLTLVSNDCPKIIGHTCISYEWAQHISGSQVLSVTLFQLSVNPVLIWL